MKYYKKIIFIALLMPLTCMAENILNIYSWGIYIPQELIKNFTQETGIQVNLSEYDSNETMFAKIKSAKHIGYDLIMPSSYFIQRMARLDMLLELDKSKISDIENLNSTLLNRKFDPKNIFSIPFSWGSTGIIKNNNYFNKNKISKWQDLWNPIYKNQLVMLNDMRDVFSAGLLSLGYSINDKDPKHIEQAYLKLIKLLPNIKLFSVDTVPNIYVDEDAAVGMAWNSDYRLGHKENKNLKYIFPQEGFPIWIDSFAILKDSPHPDNAYKFISFMLRPENAMQASMEYGYTTANLAAIKLMPKKLQNNPVFNPDTKTMKRAQVLLDIPAKQLRLYEKYWEKLKIGDTSVLTHVPTSTKQKDPVKQPKNDPRHNKRKLVK